jgi:hypothetical protein
MATNPMATARLRPDVQVPVVPVVPVVRVALVVPAVVDAGVGAADPARNSFIS